MKVIQGDLWEYHANGAWAVIPTNTQYWITKKGPRAVMGAGLAEAAAIRYPDLPLLYGECLSDGKIRYVSSQYRLILIPTKRFWRNPSIPELIEEGCIRLKKWADTNPGFDIVLPKLGCGLGALDWNLVRGIMEPHLTDDRFVVVTQR